MSRDPRHELRGDVRLEAINWFVELNEDPQSLSIRQAFDHWLRRSPEHVYAYLQVAAHWEESVPPPQARVESVEELIALAQTESNVVHIAQAVAQVAAARDGGIDRVGIADHAPIASGKRPNHLAKRRVRWPFVMAASILLPLAVGVVLWRYLFADIYSSGVGEQYTVTLDDGSTVELNSRSKIAVRFGKAERDVELLEGQALFHVAKNPLRPFVVTSGGTRVRAVGTQFDVYKKRTGTVVTVVEGRVAVLQSTPITTAVIPVRNSAGPSYQYGNMSPETRRRDGSETLGYFATAQGNAGSAAAGPKDEVFLVAGQQLTVGPRGDALLPRPQPANIETALAWTQRRLVFKEAPLSEVVNEINRYSRKPLIIADPSIAATRVSGSFPSGDPGALLMFLREVGLYDVRETSAGVEISRK